MCAFVVCKQRQTIYSICRSILARTCGRSLRQRLPATSIYLMHDTHNNIVIEVLLLLLQASKMGTNCSYNFYDSGQWNSLDHRSGVDTSKIGKRMRYFRKRAQSDPTSETSESSSELCNCRQRLNNHTDGDHSGSMFIFPADASHLPGNLRAPLSTSEIYETTGSKVHNDRLGSNVNGVGHGKCSSIFGSSKDNSKHNSDSPPHRLLTRRCHSPNYRTAGYNSRPYFGSPGFDRQRSLSWSNGRVGTKDYLRASSPTLKTSVLCSARSHRGNSGQMFGSIASKPSQTVSMLHHSPIKSSKCDGHHPACPLHVKSSESKQSTTKKPQMATDDLEDDWTPIIRRRANSESHTTRLHRQLPRTLESSEISHSHEHAHVHWADEETGTSLSTSVFLSSIRPRSYSHGAVDCAPNRPILKKMLG